eukprot:scaffold84538_cov14-Tisochrysis_lutea.AAC.2
MVTLLYEWHLVKSHFSLAYKNVTSSARYITGCLATSFPAPGLLSIQAEFKIHGGMMLAFSMPAFKGIT